MPTRHITDSHAALAIHESMEVEREEYLAHMTFQANRRPLFTEPFGPIVGLKEEWAAQGASPSELDFSAFRYRRALEGHVPVNTGWLGDEDEEILSAPANSTSSLRPTTAGPGASCVRAGPGSSASIPMAT